MNWRFRTAKKVEPGGEKVIANGIVWTELHEAKRWEPGVGEVIMGTFLGFAQRSGSFGAYRAVILAVDNSRVTITGNQLVAMIEGSTVKTGDRLRIVYLGTGITATGFNFKRFQGFVARTHARTETA